MTSPATDELACPTCKTRENLVIVGIDVAAMLGRYQEDNDANWAVKCFECGFRCRINDEARDELFGTGWRSK